MKYINKEVDIFIQTFKDVYQININKIEAGGLLDRLVEFYQEISSLDVIKY